MTIGDMPHMTKCTDCPYTGGCHGGCRRCVVHPPVMPYAVSTGCICPPTSEQTCMSPTCPRKPPAPLVVTCKTGECP